MEGLGQTVRIPFTTGEKPSMLIDCRWWWLKLKALAESKDWDGLEAFAKSKKSPIGYEPFIVRHGQNSIKNRF